MTGRAGLDSGHEVMKREAREKTWLRPRGVSYGDGKGDWPTVLRMYELWRDSTERTASNGMSNVRMTRRRRRLTGRGSGEVVGVGDLVGSAEVGRHTNTLEDGSGSEEGSDIGVAKVVSASLGRLNTGSAQSG